MEATESRDAPPQSATVESSSLHAAVPQAAEKQQKQSDKAGRQERSRGLAERELAG